MKMATDALTHFGLHVYLEPMSLQIMIFKVRPTLIVFSQFVRAFMLLIAYEVKLVTYSLIWFDYFGIPDISLSSLYITIHDVWTMIEWFLILHGVYKLFFLKADSTNT